jgi:hypothetical protein
LLHQRLMDASSLISGPRGSGQALETSGLQEPDHFDPFPSPKSAAGDGFSLPVIGRVTLGLAIFRRKLCVAIF